MTGFGERAKIGDRKGTTKKLCDKDFAERSGELSGAICLIKTLVFLANDPITPSNCSENSLVLFVRFFGFVGPFWLLKKLTHRDGTLRCGSGTKCRLEGSTPRAAYPNPAQAAPSGASQKEPGGWGGKGGGGWGVKGCGIKELGGGDGTSRGF